MRMWDSTDRHVIPADAPAVAGYGGTHNRYQSYWWFISDYPRAHHVIILVNANDDGPDGHQHVCLDIEPGNAQPASAARWVRRQQRRGVSRPILYADLSDMRHTLANLRAAGIPLNQVRLWTAHPTGRPHRCTGACGYDMPDDPVDATQYAWSPDGLNVDISELAADFFGPPAPPEPPEDTMNGPFPYVTADKRVGLAVATDDGEVLHIEQKVPNGDWWRNDDGSANWLSLGNPDKD